MESRPSSRGSFNSSSSFKRNENGIDDEEEDPQGDEHDPIPGDGHGSRRHNRNYPSSSAPEVFSPMPTSSPSGDVIVKIDPTASLVTQSSSQSEGSSQVGRDGEFSFSRPDGVIKEGQVGVGSGDRPSVSGEMMLDMDYDGEEARYQQDQARCQGLPPLPPEQVPRQSWSQNLSDVPSQDYSPYNSSFKTPVASHASKNHNTGGLHSGNLDGFKEIRVSFQESFNSEQQIRRRHSIYSTVDIGSSSSSSAGDDDEDDGESRIGRSGVQSRRVAKGGEILRCTSINASLRKIPSMGASRARSRLADIPSTPVDQRSFPKSGQLNMKSGILGRPSMMDEEEEDPFQDEDLPEEYREVKISALIVLEWVSLVVLVAALICSLIIPFLNTKTLYGMKLWKWEVLILVVICGRLVSDWGMTIIVFFIERNFLLRKRLLYFVYGLKKAVQNVIWLGLVLLTWEFLFDARMRRDEDRPLEMVTKVLVIAEIITLVWLGKTLLVKFCASTFHVNAYFDRIQEALFNQFVIETLSGPPLFDINSQDQDDFQAIDDVELNIDGGLGRTKSVRSVATLNGRNATPHKSPVGQSIRYSGPINKKIDEKITIDHLHKLNQKNISAWNMKRLMRIIRHGSLTTLDETIVQTSQDDENANQIRNENEAKAAARKIFRNVAQPHCRFIYLDDLLRFMREDEAARTMSLFEGTSEYDRISRHALKNWVVAVFRERRALALTLTDTKTAVNKLHKVVDVIVCIGIILMIATTLDIIAATSLVFLSSQLVLAAFMFGNTCKNVFESIIFLFVIHPFDVGDRCEIDGVQMFVEEMNILTTIFLRYDNLKIVYPNYTLLTKPISNFYRSPDMAEIVEFYVHIATPIEKITQMKQRIISYIETTKEHWYPDPMIILKDVENLQMLKIAIWLQHKINHQDIGERYGRRALLIEECVNVFKDLDMEYRVFQGNLNIHPMTSNNIPQIPFPNWAISDGHRDIMHT